MTAQAEHPVDMYLGLTERQFGIVMCLTSLSRHLMHLVEGKDMKNLMLKSIEEHGSKTTSDNLAWVRSQRNHLLNILHGVLVSQSLLAQVDDALVAEMTALNSTADADNNQNENSGE